MTTKYIGRSWPDAHEILHMDVQSRAILRDELDNASRECEFFEFGNPEVTEFFIPDSPFMETIWMSEIQIDRCREILDALPCPPEE